MSDFKRVVTAVLKVFGISQESLFQGGSRTASAAQRVLCHTARAMNIPRQELADKTEMPISLIYKRGFMANLLIDERDQKFISRLNAVRTKLGLPPVTEKPKEVPKRTVKSYRPFVIWSPEEEYVMQRACDASIAYMKSYGKGVAPKYVGR